MQKVCGLDNIMQKFNWEWYWLKFLLDAVVLKIIDENIKWITGLGPQLISFNVLLMWTGHVNQLEPYTTA